MKVAIVGSGRIGPRLACLVTAGEAPAGTEVVGWAPSGAAQTVPAWVGTLALPIANDPFALLAGADGIVVDLAADPHWHQREGLSEAACEGGKALLVDAPLADFAQVHDRIRVAASRSGSRILSVRPIRQRLAMRTGLGIALSDLGEVLAVYGSLHLPVRDPGPDPAPSFEQSLADLLDPVAALLRSPLVRLYAAGQAGVAVHAVGRTEGGVVVTLDVNRFLPPSCGSDGEALLEITGQDGFVRIAPDAADVTVAGPAGVRRIPWREDPLGDAVRAWLSGAADPVSDLDADRHAITALRMVKRSRALGKAVGPDGNPVASVAGAGSPSPAGP